MVSPNCKQARSRQNGFYTWSNQVVFLYLHNFLEFLRLPNELRLTPGVGSRGVLWPLLTLEGRSPWGTDKPEGVCGLYSRYLFPFPFLFLFGFTFALFVRFWCLFVFYHASNARLPLLRCATCQCLFYDVTKSGITMVWRHNTRDVIICPSASHFAFSRRHHSCLFVTQQGYDTYGHKGASRAETHLDFPLKYCLGLLTKHGYGVKRLITHYYHHHPMRQITIFYTTGGTGSLVA